MASTLNKAQQKAQKKKIIILAVMISFTAITWSKTLFGKDDKPATTAATTVAAPTNTGTKAVSVVSKLTMISSYSQAIDRMDLWPAALDRKIHVGTIEELTPINDLLSENDGTSSPKNGVVPEPSLARLLERLPVGDTPPIDFEDLGLRLTTTASFGDSAFAIISGEKVQSGQAIEVQIDGSTVRYEVRSINTRMVEITYRGNNHILSIDLPDFQNRDQKGD